MPPPKNLWMESSSLRFFGNQFVGAVPTSFGTDAKAINPKQKKILNAAFLHLLAPTNSAEDPVKSI